jgi:hypothetical protein
MTWKEMTWKEMTWKDESPTNGITCPSSISFQSGIAHPLSIVGMARESTDNIHKKRGNPAIAPTIV